MKANEITSLRLVNQQLASPSLKSVKEVVKWMGCVQSQDYGMAKWGIALRMAKGITNEQIELAINAGDVVRIHTLRPTWHFVAAEDVQWITKLTAPNIKKLMATQNRQFGLTEAIFKKCNNLIAKFLSDGKPKTREEIVLHLGSKRIVLDNLPATSVMIVAELDGIVCNGPRRGKQFTYTLLDNVVRKNSEYTRTESLYELTKRYFLSHGPATLKDFMWWSGLSRDDARNGIISCGKELVEITNKTETLYMGTSTTLPSRLQKTFLLPCYDEFTVGYADRSFLRNDDQAEFFGHFIFRPLVVHNGKAVGIWSREVKKSLFIATKFIDKPSEIQKKELKRCAKKYQSFAEAESLQLNFDWQK